jgi:hypothetical protein
MNRWHQRVSLTAVAAAVAVGKLAGQQLEPRPVHPRGVSSFTFQSPSMGVPFAINVGEPRGVRGVQPGGGRKYPALITTDGDWAFSAVHEAARMLISEGAIEDLYVVSIGTGLEDGDSTWARRRIYEFSPPDWNRQDPFGLVVTKACQDYRMPPDRCTGGAPRFLAAIVSELIPLVTAKYPIDREQLGLFGVSAGGFFAAWAIFQPSSPFRKYLISSPAMAYGDGEVFRQEARWAAEHKDLPVAIYFGAGGLEIGSGFLEGVGRIVSGMTHLSGVLGARNYPGLRITTEVHPGMGHADVVGTVAVRGLRTLYPKR